MKEFTYVVVTKEGNKVQETKQAENKTELVNFLNSQGMTIITLRENVGLSFNKLKKIEIGGIGLTEKVLLSKQLSTMISAGIPIIQAIGILSDQAQKDSVKEKLNEVYKKIESGFALSKAFKTGGGIFSEVQINLMEAGEKSGNLNEMLTKVAEDLEKSKSLRGKVLGALIYPAIILVVLVIIMAIMILFMVPQIKELYLTLGQEELPFVTQTLIDVGSSAGNPIVLISMILIIISAIIGYKFYVSDFERSISVAKIKLKIPVFGNLVRKIQLTEFCRINSMLIKSGIPIIEAIEITGNALSNNLYKKIVLDSKKEVAKGNAFSIGLAKNNEDKAFPEILIRILATGEESGKVDMVLEDMYKYYDAEVEQITANLTKLLEPFILVVVGGLVAFLAVAIYLPIYQVGNFVQ
jgi:type IV pilus assembly protein PilC